MDEEDIMRESIPHSSNSNLINSSSNSNDYPNNNNNNRNSGGDVAPHQEEEALLERDEGENTTHLRFLVKRQSARGERSWTARLLSKLQHHHKSLSV
jgi:hypothetical protein